MSLELAVKARLPLIRCTTTDPRSTAEVLRTIVGKPVKKVDTLGPGIDVAHGQVVYAIGSFKQSSGKATVEKIEAHFDANDASFILVNPTVHPSQEMPPNFYDAGEMPTPKKLVKSFLTQKVGNADLLTSVGGLTLKEVNWLLALATAQSGKLTVESLTKARRSAFPPRRGLEQVETTYDLYIPEFKLQKWADQNLPFFMSEDVDPRLVPRGLLLGGPAGTGKTMAAKWFARELGIPLYRFDLSTVMNKYVGETEKGIVQALAQADREAPCVFLIDEMEKAFGRRSSSSIGSEITGNMLSTLLWWLQEHSTRVFTVATTNNASRIPPELIRPGRLDAHFALEGVDLSEAVALGIQFAETFNVPLKQSQIKKTIDGLFADDTMVPQATITQAVTSLVKATLLSKTDSPN